MPPSASTATSVVPPPTSTIIVPCGSATARPAPIAAAIGSSISETLRAPASNVASSTAARSTFVVPLGTHSTTWENAPAAYATDEVTKHLCGHVEVRDHAVAKRANGADRRRRPPDHPPRLLADRLHPAALLVDRDDRRLEHDDAAAADEHQRVRRAQIDRQLAPPRDPTRAKTER